MICFQIDDDKRLNIEPVAINYDSGKKAFVTFDIEYYPSSDESLCYMGTINSFGGHDWLDNVRAHTYISEQGYYPCDVVGVPIGYSDDFVDWNYAELRDDLEQLEEKLDIVESYVIDRFLPLLPGFDFNLNDSISEKIIINVSVSLPEIKAAEIFDDAFRKNNGISDIDD